MEYSDGFFDGHLGSKLSVDGRNIFTGDFMAKIGGLVVPTFYGDVDGFYQI